MVRIRFPPADSLRTLGPRQEARRATSTPTGMRSSAEQQPVISVDTKKNWSAISTTTGANIVPKANPEEVRVHDFLDQGIGSRGAVRGL
jgi:hypothetical protein